MASSQSAWVASAIRPEWFFDVVAALQLFACKTGRHATRGHLQLLKSGLMSTSPPLTAQEHLARAYLVTEAVLHLVARPFRSALVAEKTEMAQAAGLDRSQATRTLIMHLAAEPPLRMGAISVSGLAERARAILDREYAGPVSIRSLAARLACHPKRLNRLFRQAYEVTIHEYVRRLRFRNGLELVRDTEEKIEVVAQMAGWRSRSAFTVAFRKAYGCSPSTYRQRRGLDWAHRVRPKL